MKLRLSIAAAIILAILCGLLLLAYLRSPRVAVTEHSLGRDITDSTRYVVSANGLHAAFIAAKGIKRRVMVDGVTGKAYNAILDDNLVFSPNGYRAFRWIRGIKRQIVVLDEHGYDEASRLIKKYENYLTLHAGRETCGLCVLGWRNP